MKKQITMIIALAVLLLPFQNCGNIRWGSAPDTQKESGLKGNGDSYSGKPFHNHLPLGLCADGTDIKSTIHLMSSGVFMQTKRDCIPLNPAEQLNPADVAVDATGTTLRYASEIYVTDSGSAATTGGASGQMPAAPPPAPPAPSFTPSCNYPEFSGTATGSECHPTSSYDLSGLSSTSVSEGSSYQFIMYNASNSTHGASGERYITYQNVAIAPGHAPNSVDLVLYSYEPVRWQIIGDTNAVRSVFVKGYHCAIVTGVDSSKVSINTYEQGANGLVLPLSINLVSTVNTYEGACQPGRAFIVN